MSSNRPSKPDSILASAIHTAARNLNTAITEASQAGLTISADIRESNYIDSKTRPFVTIVVMKEL